MIFLMEVERTGWEGSVTNICLSTSPCTKPNGLWQDSCLLWGSEKVWLKLEMTQIAMFPLPLQETKLPKELQITWICHALSPRLFFSWQPVQPGLSETIRHSHFLQVVWHLEVKSWPHAKPSIGYLLPSMPSSFQMFHSHLLLRIWVTPRTKVQTQQ